MLGHDKNLSEDKKLRAYIYRTEIKYPDLAILAQVSAIIGIKQVTKEPNKAEEAKQDTHLTIEEARNALAAISHADIIRLRKAEKFLSANNPNSTILTDAITKTWEGERSWKRGMTLPNHLYGAMKSLANNDYKKAAKRKIENLTDTAGDEKPEVAIKTSNSSPETLLIEKETQEEREKEAAALAKQVLEMFADDEDATWILMGEMDGQTAEEIRELSGMDNKRYNTTRRRIRRKLDKTFPDKKKN